MVQKCVVTSSSDLHAKNPIDHTALLQHRGIAVLSRDAGVALLDEHGWSSLAPTSNTQLTIKDVPLLVHVGRLKPLRTDGLLHAAVGPKMQTRVAVCLAKRIAEDVPDDDDDGNDDDDDDAKRDICTFLGIRWCP